MNRKPIVLIDNYDSFTYNIYQMISELLLEESDLELKVFRNDEITMDDLIGMSPTGLIISPGPGIPADAGISVDAVRQFAGKIPILGICLGHQAIAEAFGGKIIQARSIVHGKAGAINIDGKGVLRNLSNPCLFTRYHSLAVDAASLPEELEISAWAEDGEIMGLRHREWIVEGVQFHPESIGSPQGERLLANFLHWRREPLEIQGLFSKVISGVDLEQGEAVAFMNELTEGNLPEAVIGGMLTALAAKGYCPEELAGFASVLVEKCRPVEMDIENKDLLDTCGTGGDGKHTFNISSFAALIAAACGAKVAKHGNRSVSSKSGSTDFFNALGIPTDMSPSSAMACVAEEGFAYFAAPLYHGSMRHAGPVRQALKVKTIMNCIGPLANPAGAAYRIIGVYDETLLPMMARAAKALGVKRILCVHSKDGLDEVSPAAPTAMFMIDENGIETESVFNPENINIRNIRTEDLAGGDASENARLALNLIRGTGQRALREAVCLNAGAALFIANMADSIADGYEQAKAALDDGRVAKKMEALRKWTGP